MANEDFVKKTVMFVCLNTESHINSVLNMANHLNQLGHRTVFLFNEPIKNKLKELGHEVYDCLTPDLSESVASEEHDASRIVLALQSFWQAGKIVETLELLTRNILGSMLLKVKDVYNDNVEQKVKLIKPDVIVIDNYFGIPALHKLGVPYARMYAASPLGLYHHPDLPQPWLGLPSKWDKNDPKQREWNDRAYKVNRDFFDKYDAFWQSHGLPKLPDAPMQYIPPSPYLNIYMYPEELDYGREFSPLKGWQRCDCMVRDQKATNFEIPEKLRDKPGKLIYLSLGSMACADAILMKRLTSMLADCPHRFIVVTGPNHDQYELPDNMWGDKFLPQLEILTVIDLIITHGGNNTLTECFYYGVPGFVVCPLFFDQFDNAQRVQEMGLGIRLDPYNCSKEELHSAIETMLNKSDIRDRMRATSEKMQRPEARNRALNLISEFVAKH